MNIQIASDLHLEFLARTWPDQRLVEAAYGADLLVIAGDIGNGVDALKHFSNWPVPVVLVAGNHEFYGHDMPVMRDKIRHECETHGITFLDNNSITMNEVRILGCTLWTDYRLPGTKRTQSKTMAEAYVGIYDHTLIRWGHTTFKPNDALTLHEESRTWLEAELAKPWAGKTVVISHHGPHPKSVAPRFIGNTLNPAFVSDLTDLLPSVDLWIHGHVHDSCDYSVGRCHVVANPAGYIKNRRWVTKPEMFEFENPGWNPRLLVTLS